MKGGALRKRVTIQQQSKVQDSMGGEDVPTWFDVATVWAEIKQMDGTESISAENIGLNQKISINIRYRAGVSELNQIVDGANIYEIISAGDPTGQRRELVLVCAMNR